jgi:hypothetical protein
LARNRRRSWAPRAAGGGGAGRPGPVTPGSGRAAQVGDRRGGCWVVGVDGARAWTGVPRQRRTPPAPAHLFRLCVRVGCHRVRG